MTNNKDATECDGLRFFGRMSAAITHDIKNTLSIMNENAGLLEDLAQMAETGRPLDIQRVKQLGGAIKRQIRRSDGIVRNMNRFAHSVDDPVKQIGLMTSLEMFLAICRRLTDAKGITVALTPCGAEVAILTRPFHLYYLTWLLLEFCMEYAGPNRRIELAIERLPQAIQFVFKGLVALGREAEQALPVAEQRTLLAILGATMRIDIDKNEIAVLLPYGISG